MVDITYPQGITLDAASKARTHKFFTRYEGIAEDAFNNTLAPKCVELVKQGICLESRNSIGWTPLICTAVFGNQKVLLELIAKGADIEGRDSECRTPLLWAAVNGHTEIVRALIAAGADIDGRNGEGGTPLMWAARSGHIEPVQALIISGADIDARDNEGVISLMWAAHYGHADTVQVLIAAGADIESRNRNGDTSLIRAATKGKIGAINALLAKGANFHARNEDGKTVVDYGKGIKNDDLMRFVSQLQAQYETFITSREDLSSVEQMYELLSATPLADPIAPVDYAGNARKIFAHAKWENRSQAENILIAMQQDGTINAETAESIFATTFPPERSHAVSLLPPRPVRSR